ncbi:transporter substrate-binding domain-containing protein [Roseovarius sp. S4756]|uniref:transporter substrate-binding domain-containing protein n=1 Tax=Roseovarius maritimus TaxID=3342637 RepID=UPI003729B045
MKTLITAAILASLAAGSAAAQDTVRLGTEGAYPPFNFVNDAGEVDGFERELGDELCKRADLTCTWVTNDWDSIIPNLVSGNYDAIIAGMSITDERKKDIDFTSNYTQPDPSSYVVMQEGVDLTAEGTVVAAQASTIQASHIASSGATLLEFPTPEETIAAVRNGEADAAFSDKAYAVPVVEEDDGLMIVGDDVLLGDGMALGIRKSDTELNQKFSDAIDSMKEDGSLNALIEKWLDGAATF